MQSNMTARSTAVCLGIALLLCTATSVQAQGPPFTPPTPPPAEATVTVHCPGQSINDALQTPALQLNIFVHSSGPPCVENVVITRDNVTLRGANPDPGPTDVIQGDPSVTSSEAPSFGNVVLIQDAENVTVRDLILTGGTGAGLWIVNSGLQELVVVFNSKMTNNYRRGLRVSRGSAFVVDTEASGNFSEDGAVDIGRGFEVGPYASLTCRGCLSVDNIPGGASMDAIESALLVFGHSRALVGTSFGGTSSILTGRISAGLDENAFVEIQGASTLNGIMVVSDKSHLEILGDSTQSHSGVLDNAIRLDSLLEVSGANTIVGNIKVHDFSYLRSDGAMLSNVDVKLFSNGIIDGGSVGVIMCSNGSDIICPDSGGGTADPTMSMGCTCQPIP